MTDYSEENQNTFLQDPLVLIQLDRLTSFHSEEVEKAKIELTNMGFLLIREKPPDVCEKFPVSVFQRISKTEPLYEKQEIRIDAATVDSIGSGAGFVTEDTVYEEDVFIGNKEVTEWRKCGEEFIYIVTKRP